MRQEKRKKAKGKGFNCRTFNFLLLTFALGILAGCEIPYVNSSVVYEDPTNFVRLEDDPTVFEEIPQTLHSHPYRMEERTMADILRGFSVRAHRNALQRFISGVAPHEPVFRDEEIHLLADKLVHALSRAKPHERVTFYLSRPQTSIKREITTGGLYVERHSLHFILGNYHIIYGIPAYGMVYDRRYPTMPTSAKGFDLFFSPAGAVIPQNHTLWDRATGRAKDEMVIDLRKMKAGEPGRGRVQDMVSPAGGVRSVA
ncbi:MAG TPA: hypothetical protein VJ692_08375 [Nitrospiraceae bacterium]|nr:hypothetical protein [Nitrospiraceae bacterium]